MIVIAYENKNNCTLTEFLHWEQQNFFRSFFLCSCDRLALFFKWTQLLQCIHTIKGVWFSSHSHGACSQTILSPVVFTTVATTKLLLSILITKRTHEMKTDKTNVSNASTHILTSLSDCSQMTSEKSLLMKVVQLQA